MIILLFTEANSVLITVLQLDYNWLSVVIRI